MKQSLVGKKQVRFSKAEFIEPGEDGIEEFAPLKGEPKQIRNIEPRLNQEPKKQELPNTLMRSTNSRKALGKMNLQLPGTF